MLTPATSAMSPQTILFLPPHAPELNPMEHIWDELREKWFHSLERHLEAALQALEKDHARVHSIVAWPWINNALLI
ncbi:MAG: transposase [Magnetococcales bacterium]|nr:transposase [Magnetococcales bacterium]